MTILILAEHDNKQIRLATLNAVTAAQALSNNLTVLVAGKDCQQAAQAVAKINGVSKVVVADSPAYEHGLAENTAQLIVNIADDFTYILAPATSYGKNILPRVAALLDVAQISDVSKIITADTFQRSIYAGNALATVQSNDAIKVISVRTTAFSPAQIGTGNAVIETCNIVTDAGLSEFLSQELSESERPELANARVVISGGRALQSKENFKLLEALADRLKAAIGASRAAVDAGFVSNDYQVGQTGKIVAPELYIAVGISGAIQHLAGMKDSKVIVAINKDPDAPVFQIADYGLVGDLFELIPQFTAALDKL